jgi:curved DNA-binding protein CbpA
MNYFKDCKKLDEAKTLFRKLCLKLHPDTGGTNKDFIYMFNQFKSFRPLEGFEEPFNAEKFYNNEVKAFDILDDVKVSFVGSFIWLEDNEKGATYRQKDVISSMTIQGKNKARFARLKKVWYFSPEGYKQKAKSGKSLAQIKSKYGSKEYATKGKQLVS